MPGNAPKPSVRGTRSCFRAEEVLIDLPALQLPRIKQYHTVYRFNRGTSCGFRPDKNLKDKPRRLLAELTKPVNPSPHKPMAHELIEESVDRWHWQPPKCAPPYREERMADPRRHETSLYKE